MGSISWYFYVIGVLISNSKNIRKAKKLAKNGQEAESRKLMETVCRKEIPGLIKWMGVTLEVTGTENIPQEGAFVAACNHQSNMDPLVVYAAFNQPLSPLAKKELEKTPIIADVMRLIGAIFVDRKDMRSGLAALSDCAAQVREGVRMLIFPEGTRSADYHVGTFKSGAVRIASEAEVPIVPVALDGMNKVLPRGKIGYRKGTVRIHIFPPIPTAGLDRKQQREITPRMQAMISEYVENLHAAE